MPVIQFSVGDVLRSRVLEIGWKSFVVKEIKPELSADKMSMNYIATFMLIDENPELDGKEIVRYFNSKAISMMLPLVYASKGIKLADTMKEKPEAIAIDTDEIVGKKVDCNIKQDTYQGNVKNIVEEYAPYKSMKGAGPAF